MSCRAVTTRAVQRCAGIATTTLIALLWGCSDNVVGVDPQAVHSVEIEPDSLLLVSLGETATLAATVRNFLGGILERTVLWSADDSQVATVDADGTVTAVGNGATLVRATLRGKVDSVAVTVRQDVASITSQGDGQTGTPGAPLGSPITVTILDEHGNAIEGADVEFTVFSGGGSVSPSSGSTNTTGSFSTTWTLGTSIGLQELDVVAGLQGEGTLRITATAN